MQRFPADYKEPKNEWRLYLHTGWCRRTNTFHDPNPHEKPNSMLLIIEHRGLGLANTPNRVPKVTDWTESRAAMIGTPARQATGSRRRCQPRFADVPGRYPSVTGSRPRHSFTDGYERLPELHALPTRVQRSTGEGAQVRVPLTRASPPAWFRDPPRSSYKISRERLRFSGLRTPPHPRRHGNAC